MREWDAIGRRHKDLVHVGCNGNEQVILLGGYGHGQFLGEPLE
jgi:hypothetical protein